MEFSNYASISDKAYLECDVLAIGDYSTIDEDVRIIAPQVIIGDFVRINNHVLIYGKEPIVIGHNCWIGQNAVLNSEKTLRIFNNVGIGAYSSVWTHGYFGDILAGCQIFETKETTLYDDAWILGNYTSIYPGANIGEKALVMPGSVVTKPVEPNTAVAGSPAKKISVVPYKERTERETEALFFTFAEEYVMDTLNETPNLDAFNPHLRMYEKSTDEREFLKQAEFIKWLRGYRARFVPSDNRRINI